MADAWEIAGVVLGGITSISSTCIAFVALQVTAKPRIRISLIDPSDGVIQASRPFRLIFRIQNRGHWFAHPAATGIRLYFNFQQEFTLSEVHYGNDPQFVGRNVHNGKGGSKYLVAKNIRVTYSEEAEEMALFGAAPSVPGLYRCWVSAFSNEGMDYKREYRVEAR
jgi:hypothetical protein